MVVWLKLIGALCLIVSGGMYGFISALNIRQRQHCLERCLCMFTSIKQQLIYSGAPPIDIMRAVMGMSDMDRLDFIEASIKSDEQFSNGWRKSVMQSYLPLTYEDKQIVSKLSDILGRYDIDTQVKYIELVISNLELVLNKLHKINDNEIKLTQTLSLLAGIFLAILII